ncbi:hypothetical protein [Mesorhizobium sp.]|uniref:hypothetical protein n=1 Tax=Mesorhizobium sp. TaxID=1871066 RepID=UPI0025BAB88F|nr:hypothetical protein [Mesorhizobium sp.]
MDVLDTAVDNHARNVALKICIRWRAVALIVFSDQGSRQRKGRRRRRPFRI